MSFLADGLHCLIIVFCLFRIPGASLLNHQPTPNGRNEYISIQENKGLTVAFPADISVNEAKILIENAKWVFGEASKAVHKATGGLTSFEEINFLLPRSWPIPESNVWDIFNPPVTVSHAKKETYEWSAFRVVSNEEFQGASVDPRPVAVQYAGCGKPGKYVLVPKNFFKIIPTTSEPLLRELHVKHLVKEWARYRFGVFEERGYADNPLYPLFSTIPGSAGHDNYTALLNSCTNAELAISEKDSNGGECKVSVNETTGLPAEDNCYMDPIIPQNTENSELKSSLMFSPEIAHGYFCDSDSTIRHNPLAPNKQNAFCEGKSIMAVIRESPDIQLSEKPYTPRFNFFHEPDFRLAILLDIGQHMLKADSFPSPTKEPMDTIRAVLERFFEQEIPANITAYVGSFNSNEEVTIYNGTINDKDRLALYNQLKRATSDPKDSCLYCALLALRGVSKDYPLTVMAITNAKMVDSTKLRDFLEKNQQIKLNLIVYPTGVTIDPKLRETILSNGGTVIDVKTSGYVATIVRLQEALSSVLSKESLRKEITKEEIYDTGNKSVPFSLNQIQGIKNLGICLYQNRTSGTIYPVETDSLEVTLGSELFTVDDTIQPEKFQFLDKNILPECPTYCFTFPGDKIAPEGSFNFTVQSEAQIMVKIWVVSSPDSKYTTLEINLRSWFEWVHKDEGIPNAVIIYAELRQGRRPIRGADVRAEISLAEDDAMMLKSQEVKLYDNGAGDPDISRDDGIYSRYFSAFGKSGSYTVSIFASGYNGTVQVLEQFPIQDFSRAGTRWNLLDNFKRSLPMAASFQVNWKITENVDTYPPNRIVDLRVLEARDREIVLAWTTPGNNYDDDTPASQYKIKYFTSLDDARLRFSETGSEVSVWHQIQGQPLKPKNYGESQEVYIKLPIEDKGGLLYFALTTSDESNNTSPVSNVVVAYLTTLAEMSTDSPVPTLVPGNGTSGNYKSGGLTNVEIGLIVGFVLIGVILIIAVVIVVIYLRRKKDKKDADTFSSMRPRANAPAVTPQPLGGGEVKPSFETPRNGNAIPTRYAPDPPDPARLSVANGDHIQSWPAETLLSHYDRVQEAKQRNQPRPILSVGDLLESLSESNSSVASVPVQHQNGTIQHIRRENGTAQPRPSSQLSSHSKQVTQV